MAVMVSDAVLPEASTKLTKGAPDEIGTSSRRFLIHVDSTLESLQKQEDTDNNMQITIEDSGPKVVQRQLRISVFC